MCLTLDFWPSVRSSTLTLQAGKKPFLRTSLLVESCEKGGDGTANVTLVGESALCFLFPQRPHLPILASTLLCTHQLVSNLTAICIGTLEACTRAEATRNGRHHEQHRILGILFRLGSSLENLQRHQGCCTGTAKGRFRTHPNRTAQGQALYSLIAGTTAGAVEGFTTYPIEYTKTVSQFAAKAGEKAPGPITIVRNTIARTASSASTLAAVLW